MTNTLKEETDTEQKRSHHGKKAASNIKQTRVLITGATGFVGSHLAEYLFANTPYTVYGTKRRRSDTSNIKTPIMLLDCEISDPSSVEAVLQVVKPDIIFHLAAQSFVPASFEAPRQTFDVNFVGSINLFEAARKHCPSARIQIASSSEVYGLVYPDDLPITETTQTNPQSPYAVSKLAMDLYGQWFYRAYGQHIVITRAFNHTGPRRGEELATSNFAKQIALIEAGKQEPVISHGNLLATRDWTDVRDMVRAYVYAIERCKPGEPYNIASGKDVEVAKMLGYLLGFSRMKIVLKPNEARMRPSEVPRLQGDYTKFRQQTGWEPTIPFHKTLEDLLHYWRERV